MSNNARRRERQAEIALFDAEGALAAREGKSKFTMPSHYRNTMNAVHWMRGYDDERQMMDEEERREAAPAKRSEEAEQLIEWLENLLEEAPEKLERIRELLGRV
jgi:hypothetical protein